MSQLRQCVSGTGFPLEFLSPNRWPHFGHCEAASNAFAPQASHRVYRIRFTSGRKEAATIQVLTADHEHASGNALAVVGCDGR